MEKRMMQLLIGGLVAIALAGILFWFFKLRARTLSCADNPSSPACWHLPDRNQFEKR